jgi:D-alanine transaminase
VVFLNQNFIAKDQAFVSVMDRGFLFGDGVYEVIPAYQKRLFRLNAHLLRLQKSLTAIGIKNPYNQKQWCDILEKLLHYNKFENQSIYLQITRGSDKLRQHNFDTLTPNVFIQSSQLIPKTQSYLATGFCAISSTDIRWGRCDIKSTSLLANILYAQKAKDLNAQEVVLHKNNLVTEGATSNVFMLKNSVLYTHPADTHILAGITRDLVLESAKQCRLSVKEQAFSLKAAYQADEIWISSSTREIMPITRLDGKKINQGMVGGKWACVYQIFQQLKHER